MCTGVVAFNLVHLCDRSNTVGKMLHAFVLASANPRRRGPKWPIIVPWSTSGYCGKGEHCRVRRSSQDTSNAGVAETAARIMEILDRRKAGSVTHDAHIYAHTHTYTYIYIYIRIYEYIHRKHIHTHTHTHTHVHVYVYLYVYIYIYIYI